ncbi:MAG: AmmeMemoRadiSam system radical SAM enzyme [Candidatus Omnitrophota bacterium]
MKEALLYIKLAQQKVHCQLCAHECKVPEGKFGFCGVRQNIQGVLYTHNFGKLVAANVDPVEKKPLYHFLPGTKTFSIASAGCNFRCGFCQNWKISQSNYINQKPGEEIAATKIVNLAKQNGCQSIAYTYTEPTIYFEFALKIAKLAKAAGLYNIFVTNGYMSARAISLIRPYLDAVNVDLKFFKEDAYKKICSGSLGPVLDSVRLLNKLGIWTEITTLVIPRENDSVEELSGIAEFISKVNKDIPWHISAFHPNYKFDAYPQTPKSTLNLAYELGKKQGLRYIYVGNIDGGEQDTRCNQCGEKIIKREDFSVIEANIIGNKCKFCQKELPGVYIS